MFNLIELRSTVFFSVRLILLISIIILLVKIVEFVKVKKRYLMNEIEHKNLSEFNRNKTADYSNSILEFIQGIVAQITIIKFKNLIDSKPIDKITKENVKKLINDISIMTNESINWNNITLMDTFLTKEFFETYIIEMANITVKGMLDKALENSEE